MNTKYIKFLSVFLIICMLLPLDSCNGRNDNLQNNSDEGYNYGDSSNSFMPSQEYNIVSHANYKRTSEITEAVGLVQKAVECYGVKTNLVSDRYSKGDTVKPGEYEILIGYTGRESSQRIISTLGVNDYTYIVESENTIVICGGSPEATLEAAKKFCKVVLDYNEATKKAFPKTINVGASYIYRDNYKYSGIKINNVSIEDFVIAIPNMNSMYNAQKVLKFFSSQTGAYIPIILNSELDGSERGVICVDSFSLDGKKEYDLDRDGAIMRFSGKDSRVVIYAGVSDSDYYDKLLNKFKRSASASEEGLTLKISLPQDDIELFDYEKIYDGLPVWTLTYEKEETVRDGVTYIYHEYIGDNELPYKAYILLVDPSKASLYMGSGNDSYEPRPDPSIRQSVVGHMRSAVSNGVDVIAGVNGDFFAIETTYMPIGLAIKEGKVVTEASQLRPFCGFTKDGHLEIHDNGFNGDKTKYRTVVSGSDIIVKHGIPNDLDEGTYFGDTHHPRTMVGIREDGTIILAVIDGRQWSHSNGASLAMCARFMISLGATTAMNLDGGGSSTMVIRDGNSYNVMNSPSDGSPRKVATSILVVAN